MSSSGQIGPGQVIDGRYELVRELGVGGAGQIWLANDSATGAQVALKKLHPRLVTVGAARTRFEREARVLQEMDHPHVARLLGVHLKPPRPYFALEFVPGRSFRQEIAVRAETSVHFGPGTLQRIFGQLCDAVQHAHEAGVIHRDLTPANVLLDERVEPFQIKVVDFGIAKILDGDGHDPTTRGRRIGTLAFMAPEQARGEPIDHRTDIFAIGVLLFEALTLRRPWYLDGGGGPLRAYSEPVTNNAYNTPSELVSRICGPQRPLPSKVRADLGPNFDHIVQRALAVDPADRYSKPNALFDDLDEALNHNDWTAAVVVHGAIRGDTLARPEITESEHDEPSLQTQVVTSDDIHDESIDPVPVVKIGGPTELMDSSPFEKALSSLSAPSVEPAAHTRILDEPRAKSTALLPDLPLLRDESRYEDVAIATNVATVKRASRWPLVAGAVVLLAAGYGLGRLGESTPEKKPDEKPEVAVVPTEAPAPVLVPRTTEPEPEIVEPDEEPEVDEVVEEPEPVAPTKRATKRSVKPRRTKAKKPPPKEVAKPNPGRPLRALLKKMRADPQQRYRSGELGRRIAEAAKGIQDPKTRRAVERIAETSGFSADLDGLEQAIAKLERGIAANP